MRLTGFARTDTRKHSEKFLKNAKNKNLLKIKRILNTEIQANRGPIFHVWLVRGGRRAPLPPRQLRHWPNRLKQTLAHNDMRTCKQ